MPKLLYHRLLCKSLWLNVTYSLGSGLRSGEEMSDNTECGLKQLQWLAANC